MNCLYLSVDNILVETCMYKGVDIINGEYPPGVFFKGLKFSDKKIRNLKILGFSRENTAGGYSPLKMTAP